MHFPVREAGRLRRGAGGSIAAADSGAECPEGDVAEPDRARVPVQQIGRCQEVSAVVCAKLCLRRCLADINGEGIGCAAMTGRVCVTYWSCSNKNCNAAVVVQAWVTVRWR